MTSSLERGMRRCHARMLSMDLLGQDIGSYPCPYRLSRGAAFGRGVGGSKCMAGNRVPDHLVAMHNGTRGADTWHNVGDLLRVFPIVALLYMAPAITWCTCKG